MIFLENPCEIPISGDHEAEILKAGTSPIWQPAEPADLAQLECSTETNHTSICYILRSCVFVYDQDIGCLYIYIDVVMLDIVCYYVIYIYNI